MSKAEDTVRLRHILDAAQEALGFVKDRRRDDFEKDRILVLALIKEVEIIGEAASRISAGMKARHPQIPWAMITGMRNHLIHVYFDIDFDLLWKTITEDLPPLASEIEKVLSREDTR